MVESGERVRNTWVIYLQVEDNFSKGELILNVVLQRMLETLKLGILRDLAPDEEPASHQLVGEVTAHKAYG